MDELVIFRDSKRSELLTSNDFQTVPVGQSKTLTGYIANLSPDFKITNVKVKNPDQDLIIEGVLEELKPDEILPIKITFKPRFGRRERFNCFSGFNGTLVIV